MTKFKLITTLILLFLALYPAFSRSAQVPPVLAQSRTRVPDISLKLGGFDLKKDPAKAALDLWVRKMAYCESTNNPKAVNEVDLDGTPSYGLYQFKTGTFRHYVEKYGLFDSEDWARSQWKKAIWNGEYQETVFRKMLEDPEVDLHHEFPDCTRRLGLPPTIHQLTAIL